MIIRFESVANNVLIPSSSRADCTLLFGANSLWSCWPEQELLFTLRTPNVLTPSGWQRPADLAVKRSPNATPLLKLLVAPHLNHLSCYEVEFVVTNRRGGPSLSFEHASKLSCWEPIMSTGVIAGTLHTFQYNVFYWRNVGWISSAHVRPGTIAVTFDLEIEELHASEANKSGSSILNLRAWKSMHATPHLELNHSATGESKAQRVCIGLRYYDFFCSSICACEAMLFLMMWEGW